METVLFEAPYIEFPELSLTSRIRIRRIRKLFSAKTHTNIKKEYQSVTTKHRD
jgi:hypothetical protein